MRRSASSALTTVASGAASATLRDYGLNVGGDPPAGRARFPQRIGQRKLQIRPGSLRAHGAFDNAEARSLDEVQRLVFKVGIKRQLVEAQLRILRLFRAGRRIQVRGEIRMPVVHGNGVVVEEGRRNQREPLALLARDQRVNPGRMAHSGRRQVKPGSVIKVPGAPHDDGVEAQFGHHLVGLLEIHARSKDGRRHRNRHSHPRRLRGVSAPFGNKSGRARGGQPPQNTAAIHLNHAAPSPITTARPIVAKTQMANSRSAFGV